LANDRKPLWADPSNPFLKEHRDDIANRSANPVFSEVAEVFLSRRRFLQMGAVAGAAVSFPFLIKPERALPRYRSLPRWQKRFLGFTSIDVSTGRYGEGAGRLYCPPVLSLG
jgi:hypothetical protein